MRSPEVCAENAPRVSASSGCTSTVLEGATGMSAAGLEALELLKGNIDMGHKENSAPRIAAGKDAYFRRVFVRRENLC